MALAPFNFINEHRSVYVRVCAQALCVRACMHTRAIDKQAFFLRPWLVSQTAYLTRLVAVSKRVQEIILKKKITAIFCTLYGDSRTHTSEDTSAFSSNDVSMTMKSQTWWWTTTSKVWASMMSFSDVSWPWWWTTSSNVWTTMMSFNDVSWPWWWTSASIDSVSMLFCNETA